MGDQMFMCDYCGSKKKKMAILQNTKDPKQILTLCFKGCQNFPEPYDKVDPNRIGEWKRVDPWVIKKSSIPKRQVKFKGDIIQTKLEVVN